MKLARIVLWAFVVLFTGIAGYAWLDSKRGPAGNQTASVKIGGPFELVDHRGLAITHEALQQRNHAVFFGFTHCPDICPTTLYEVAGWMNTLGEDVAHVDFYFFTVDPERDTPEVMNDYVSAFDPRIVGVTGNAMEMDKAIKNYRAYAKRVDLEDGDYTMDHSAFVMLFDDTGDFKGTISYGENTDTAVMKLRRLINNG